MPKLSISPSEVPYSCLSPDLERRNIVTQASSWICPGPLNAGLGETKKAARSGSRAACVSRWSSVRHRWQNIYLGEQRGPSGLGLPVCKMPANPGLRNTGTCAEREIKLVRHHANTTMQCLTGSSCKAPSDCDLALPILSRPHPWSNSPIGKVRVNITRYEGALARLLVSTRHSEMSDS